MSCFKNKKGISLILLVITIIVIIIIAGAIILSLSNNNPIKSAEEANFKNTVKNYQEELQLWLAQEYAITEGSLDITTVNATKDSGTYLKDGEYLTISDIITIMTDEDQEVFEIDEAELVYIGDDEEKAEWFAESNGTAISVNGDSDDYDGPTVPIQADAGESHSAVLMSDGTVKMWGRNNYGQLGDGTYDDCLIPKTVPNLSNVVQIASGEDNMLALLEDGTVYAWGDNCGGEIGDGTYDDCLSPKKVEGLSNVVQIAAGSFHSLALLDDKTVKVWGANWDGQLGDGTYDDSLVPKIMSGISNVAQIAGGYEHTLLLLEDGTVKSCGYNSDGELGIGTNVDSTFLMDVVNAPVDISTLVDMEIEGMWSDTFDENYLKINFTSDGSVSDLGYIIKKIRYVENGQTMEEELSEPIVNLNYEDDLDLIYEIDKPNATSIAVNFSLLSTENYCDELTIYNSSDEELIEYTGSIYTDSLSLLSNDKLENVSQIAAGDYYSLAITNDGTVKAWGANWDGALGDGSWNDSLAPINMQNVSNAKQISGGYCHTLTLLNDDTVKACGWNRYGQIGDGETDDVLTPKLIDDLSNVKYVAGGYYHSIVILNDGTVKVFGRNNYGQLGDGTTDDSLVPIEIDLSVPLIVNFETNGGYTSSTIVTVEDIVGNGIDNSSLQYCWSDQNAVEPTRDWYLFSNGESITKNIMGEYYLWIKASDNTGSSVVEVSNKFIIPEEIVSAMSDVNQTFSGTTTGYAYNNPVIPAGFVAVDTIDARWTNLSTDWNNGLVIQDEVGNQFVWIPVDGENVIYQKDYNNYDYSYPGNYDTNQTDYAVIDESIQVNAYGGFYLSRYDVGINSTEETEIWTGFIEGNKVTINYESWDNGEPGCAVEEFIISKIKYIEDGIIYEEELEEPIEYLDSDGTKADGNEYYEINKTNATAISVQFSLINFAQDFGCIRVANYLNEMKYAFDIGNLSETAKLGKLFSNTDSETSINIDYNEFKLLANLMYRMPGVTSGFKTLTQNDTVNKWIENSGYDDIADSMYRRVVLYIEPPKIDINEEIVSAESTYNKTFSGATTGYSYNNPVIPAGFVAVNTNDVKWTNLSTDWNKGLVVQDENANQFVWVPVDGVNVKYEKFDGNVTYLSYSETSDDTLPVGVSNENDQILNYGGFYIARFEAAGEDNDTLVSKRSGKVLYEDIQYTPAKTKAESMYNTTFVKSGLITGTQWDTTMKWLQNCGYNIESGNLWGNYTGDRVKSVFVGGIWGITSNDPLTGYSEYWKSNNIYDLAGNMWEWTTEKHNFTERVVRGGIYRYSTNYMPVMSRFSCTGDLEDDHMYEDVTFRVVLYIQ